MHQTLHIFRKDVRHLQREIAFLAVLALLFAAFEVPLDFRGWAISFSWVLEILIYVTIGYVIARVIHAEAIPGTSQFWTTRPYRWQSLLGAKLLFILAFINLPVLLTQILLLGVTGFSPAANWRGLLWCQFLLIVGLELPLASLAAMTRGLIAFVASVLVSLLALVGLLLLIDRKYYPDSVEWLRYSIPLLAALIIAPGVLYLQYRRRTTLYSRLSSFVAASLTLTVFVLTPWASLFAVQARFSKIPIDIQVAPVEIGRFAMMSPDLKDLTLVVPLQTFGVPVGIRLQFETFNLTLQAPDGHSLRLREGQLFIYYQSGKDVTIRGSSPVDRDFYRSQLNQPLTLHGSFYFTAFGHALRQTVAVPDSPKGLSPDLQYYVNGLQDIVFRAPFRMPAKSIEVLTPSKSAETRQRTPYSHPVSYSPFPATLSLDPVRVSEPYFLGPGQTIATIVIEEPLAHLRRDFEISGFRIHE